MTEIINGNETIENIIISILTITVSLFFISSENDDLSFANFYTVNQD